MLNQFNLIDEPWIPLADVGRVGLREVFQNANYSDLGGDPLQKIAVFKLLLAIAQSACTPKDEVQWLELGVEGMAQKCLSYLDKWYDHFYLYGDKPFLQMPKVKKARSLSYGNFLPQVSTGNTTVLTEIQVEKVLSNADKALVLLQQMAFAFAGKKTDNNVVLSKGYTGKQNARGRASSGRAGPSLGHLGALHHFIMAPRLRESIWLNLLTEHAIEQTKMYSEGVGRAPWELMPQGEDCERARELKSSYMGRLLPLCRFCLLQESDMHYTEGIAHDNYREGIHDLSVAVDYSGRQPKVLWTDPEKKPWRELTSLLSFLANTKTAGFHCWQLYFVLPRAKQNFEEFFVFSAGLRVSSTAGEQFVSGTDDFVESHIFISSDLIGEIWFQQLTLEVSELEGLARNLYVRVRKYYDSFKEDGAKFAVQATGVFWQLCERVFQELVDSCGADSQAIENRQKIRAKIARYLHEVYDSFCPKETARQIDAWARNRPHIGKYLAQEVHT